MTTGTEAIDYLSFFVMMVVYCMFFAWYAFVLFSNRKTIHCVDLITDRSGKVSRTALLNLSGLIVASWTPIHMAITGKIDPTVFGPCLTYLAGVELFSKWLAHKEGATKPEATKTP